MQRFGRVDIPEPRDDPLVEQREFQGHLLPSTRARQRRSVERGRERLRTEPAEHRVARELQRRQQIHEAKAAWIVERDDGTGRHPENDMIVQTGRRCASVDFGPVDPKRARHAEVHQQRLVRGQRSQEILGAPGQRVDGLPFEPRAKTTRKRTAKVGATQIDADDLLVREMGLELTAHRFDFREFRHAVRIIGREPCELSKDAAPKHARGERQTQARHRRRFRNDDGRRVIRDLEVNDGTTSQGGVDQFGADREGCEDRRQRRKRARAFMARFPDILCR
jgi:hypothetical protein